MVGFRPLCVHLRTPSLTFHRCTVPADTVVGREQKSIGNDFETHRQSHPKSETEGTSSTTIWASVQQNPKKKKDLLQEMCCQM